VRRFWK